MCVNSDGGKVGGLTRRDKKKSPESLLDSGLSNALPLLGSDISLQPLTRHITIAIRNRSKFIRIQSKVHTEGGRIMQTKRIPAVEEFIRDQEKSGKDTG